MLVLISTVISGWVVLQQLFAISTFDSNFALDYVLIVFLIIVGSGLPFLMYITELNTEVTDYGVCIRFRPFHRKWLVFGFDSIDKTEANTYSPLKDYGGWGIRYGRNGKAYNVSGNTGVLITFKDGKNILIGSKTHEVLNTSISERLSSI